MVVAAPSDENEARLLLSTCYQHPGPAAVRYPRGAGCGARVGDGLDTVEIGKGVVRHEGGRIAILGFGTRVPEALEARSEEHTSELQSLMRISYAVFCLKKKKK